MDGQQAYEKMLNITNHQGNVNQNLNEIITSHLSECLVSKRLQITFGEDVMKREFLYTVGGNVNCCSNYGKQYGVLQKIKSETSI